MRRYQVQAWRGQRYRLAGAPVVPDPGDCVPRVPPEIVPLAPAPDRVPPVETLTSVDWPVVPERCTVPDSSRIVVRRLAGTDLSSSTVVERAALPRLRLVATLPDDFERFTVRRSLVAGSSETVVERRVVTLGCSEVSVRVRTDVPLSRDSTPTEAPPRPPGDWTEPPVVVEVFGRLSIGAGSKEGCQEPDNNDLHGRVSKVIKVNPFLWRLVPEVILRTTLCTVDTAQPRSVLKLEALGSV
jgi:hypothetical protein